jgi:hypothetical protein
VRHWGSDDLPPRPGDLALISARTVGGVGGGPAFRRQQPGPGRHGGCARPSRRSRWSAAA